MGAKGERKGSVTELDWHVAGECFVSLPLLLTLRLGSLGVNLVTARELLQSNPAELMAHATDICASRADLRLLVNYTALCLRAIFEQVDRLETGVELSGVVLNFEGVSSGRESAS